MTRSKIAIGVAVAAALALVSVAPGAMASAAPKAAAKPSARPTAIGGKVKVDANATLAYWTPARRAAAKDADIAVAGAPQTEAVHTVKAGKPGKVEGGLPGGKTAATRVANSAMRPDAFSYPYPYDSWNVPVNKYKHFPWSVNGKIFFTNDGSGYVCSGTVVPSYNGTQNEVWTAGHCLMNTEGLDGNLDSALEFIPAYNGTKAGKKAYPLGIFTWSGSWESNTAWTTNRDLSEDEAAFLVKRDSKGQTLGNVTGWAGFAWNQSTDQQFEAFGYPAESPYDGTIQVTDLGEASASLDSGAGGVGTTPIGIGNPMTGGSSGGAWFIGWTESGTGYVNGHNDYKYTSTQPLAMYSPYQDTLSNQVRCFGASSC